MFRPVRTALKNARVLPLMIETLRHDDGAEARWRDLLHNGEPSDLLAIVTTKRMDEKGRAHLRARRIAAAWDAQKAPTAAGKEIVVKLAEGVSLTV